MGKEELSIKITEIREDYEDEKEKILDAKIVNVVMPEMILQ